MDNLRQLSTNRKGLKIIASLLLACAVTSGLFLSPLPATDHGKIYASDITVASEAALRQAINSAYGSLYVIELGSNIQLSDNSTIIIPAHKDIMLVGDKTLYGAFTQTTVEVHGTLTIDGITITHSDSGGGGSGVIVKSGGTLNMLSGAISGNRAAFSNIGGVINGGGGVYVEGYGTFKMSGTASISNNRILNIGINDNSAGGGGVYVAHGGLLEMSGSASIYGNTIWHIQGSSSASVSSRPLMSYGGGVYIANGGTLEISGAASISNNTIIYMINNSTPPIFDESSRTYGGGVYNSGTINMSGGSIFGNKIGFSSDLYDNSPAVNGGGVYNSGTFNMSGGTISNNCAYGNSNGGGIYVSSNGLFKMTGSASIMNNQANIMGGGIYTDNYSYANSADAHKYTNISIASAATVSGNYAGTTHIPPSNASDFTTRTTNPFNGFLLDNNNINYQNPKPPSATTITFDKNTTETTIGPTPASKSVTFSYPYGPLATISRDGYIFDGWYLEGTCVNEITPATIMTTTSDHTLYAKWTLSSITVTYMTNHGFSDTTIYDSDNTKKYGGILQAPPNPVWDGYKFEGWYKEAACENAWDFSSPLTTDTGVDVSTNPATLTLYAKWTPSSDISYIVHYYLQNSTTPVAPDKTVTGQTMGRSITEAAISVPSYTSLPPASDTKILEASNNEFIFYYAKTYTVTVSESSAASTGADTYTAGTTVTISAGAKSGYIFSRWSVRTDSDVTIPLLIQSATTTFTMPPDNVTATAIWDQISPPDTHTVTYEPGTHGTFSSQVTADLLAGDPTPTAPTITGESGWIFTGWLPDISPTVTESVVYVAQWESSRGTNPGTDTEKWALINLIFCGVSAVLALLMLIWAFAQRGKGVNYIWLFITLIVGIAGGILFLCTEDIQTSMGYIDAGTIPSSIIFALAIVGTLFTLKGKGST